MKQFYHQEFELRYFEMNKQGEASPITMLTLLEETAADHCHSIDHSLYDLEEQGIGWVLVSGIMEMDRYPTYKEKIVIKTWLSNYSTVRGVRENIIYTHTGEIIGKARGLWVFFDIHKRRPVPIYPSIKELWSYSTATSLPKAISKKIQPVDDPTSVNEFQVNKFDVDTNNHVNNIRYLNWLMESMPEEVVNEYHLRSIEGCFVSEAHYGDTLLSFTQDKKEDHTFAHTIRTKSGQKVCATANTLWRKRGG